MKLASGAHAGHCLASEAKSLTNAELVDRMRADPHAAAPLLYHRFEPRIRWVVRRMMGTDPDQRDVVQQIFFDLVRSGFDLREPEKLPGWIQSIAVCAVYNELRRRRMRRMLSETTAPVVARDFVRDVEARDLLARAVTMIEHLPRLERTAFTMRVVEGHTFDEAARLVGCSIATIKRRFARANRRMLSMISRNSELMLLARTGSAAGSPFAKRAARRAVVGDSPASSN